MLTIWTDSGRLRASLEGRVRRAKEKRRTLTGPQVSNTSTWLGKGALREGVLKHCWAKGVGAVLWGSIGARTRCAYSPASPLPLLSSQTG